MSDTEQFTIDVIELHWLQDAEETTDLCAHGKVRIVVGDEVVCGPESGDWTLSAAAIHLMRTINADYKPASFAGQLVPCCGFTVIPDQDRRSVVAFSCPNGIEWSVRHSVDRETVTLTTEDGGEHVVESRSYRAAILAAADSVEAFYAASKPKRLPDDHEERAGYLLLWKEWARLRGREG